MAKQVIKDETLVSWILLCVVVAVPLVLLDSLLVWILYDCWPLRSSWTSNCSSEVPALAWHLAAVFGSAFVIGSVLAWKILAAESDE